MIDKLDRWHKTRPGLLAFALVELAAGYGFASLAIDHGNLLYYILAILLLFGFLQNLFLLIRRVAKR